MAIPFLEFVTHPFTAFNFSVEIDVRGVSKQVCNAAFSECDGLEMTMEVKTIREGGNNGRLIRLTGPTGYGTLTLKRGMTSNFDLWDWFAAVSADPGLRADAEVVIVDSNGITTLAGFVLSRCVPVKLKAPALNAIAGAVAVEELQLAYETLALKKPDPEDAMLSKLTGGLSEQFG
jgi:phage tail-like protein